MTNRDIQPTDIIKTKAGDIIHIAFVKNGWAYYFANGMQFRVSVDFINHIRAL